MIRSIHLLRASVVAGALFGIATASHAADITSYYVRKGLVYSQSSAAAPSANPFTPAEFIARANVNLDVVTDVLLSSPSDIFPQVPLDVTGDHYELLVPGGEGDVNAFFPAGSYSFTFNGGQTVAPLTFGAGAFPTAVPQLINFSAAQSINASADFALTFSPFTGAGAGDTYEFEVLDSDGSVLFSKSGAPVTSVTIPAGTLTTDQSYDARLRFVHTTSTDTTTVAGATGSTGYFKETQFSLSTGSGGGGGGDDTEAPLLVFTFPQNGATGVTTNAVIFSFSESMARQQSIQWSANVNAANFTYTWGFDDQLLTATYSGNFPANATVSYTLNGGATGFKDLAGNALITAQGSFSTGSGGGSTNNPCNTNSTPTGMGGGFLSKSLQFVQTGNNTPTADPEDPASAFASYSAATNQTVTAVKVTGPNNVSLTLSNLFGTSYVAFADFTSGAAMEAGLPAGNYTVTATGAGSGTVAIPNAATLPVPKINNLAEFLGFDPTKDFTLTFAPFTGATANDSIYISIYGNQGDSFQAPDICLNRQLPNTATSVVIPANTFKAGEALNGSISFSRLTFNTNAIPNTALTASASVTTSFELTAGGGSGSSDVRWSSVTVNANGSITFTAQVATGTSLIVQRSTDLKAWADVQTIPVTNGTATFTVENTPGVRAAFYRAKLQ